MTKQGNSTGTRHATRARWGGFFAIAVAVAVALCSGQSKAAPVAVQSGVQVDVIGSGRPVLMIPGLASSAGEVWRDTCAALQPGVQCHLVQLPGFAGAPAAPQEPWLPAMRDAVLRYVADQKLERPAVIGHSLGGALALMMAAEKPDALGPLVIVDALPFLAGIRDPNGTEADARKAAAAMRAAPPQPPEQRAAQQQQMAAGMSRTPEGQARIVAMGKASDPATVTLAMSELWGTDLRPLLPRITQPVHVLGSWAAYATMGSTQESTKAIFARQYQGLAKPADIQMSAAGYHFLMWDDKDWLVGQIRTALGR